MKILIIDDSVVSRMITKKTLMSTDKFEAEITEAVSGKEGLYKIENNPPEVILLDILMPEMTGFEFLEKLNDKGIDIPVIVLSADIQNTTRTKALDSGAAGFLNKPPSPKDLEEAILKIRG